MMARHEVPEPAPADEQPSTLSSASPALTPSFTDTTSMNRHDPDNASTDLSAPAESNADDDDDGSDYDLAQTEGDSDEDITIARKKHSKNIETEPLEIEELHEEWHKWEESYIALQHKETTTQLSKWSREEMQFARWKLEAIFKQIPTSDPLKSSYANVLKGTSTSEYEGRKRKHDSTDKRHSKKARLAQSIPSRIPSPSGSKTASRQATKQQPRHHIINQLELFKEQGHNAGLDSKRLKSEVKNLETALSNIGEHSITAQDGRWLIGGMKTSLYNYQLDGVGWAVRREKTRLTPENPRGGILADEMGCGKTITMLAVMIAKPAPKSHKIKATLLLVQNSAAVRHWQTQIRRHCNEGILPAFWYSQKTGLNEQSLKVDQVVIMTYGEIQRAWARIEAASRNQHINTKEKDGDNDLDIYQEKLLFEMTYHRLILDECQYVKNHNGATAKAVFQLKSRVQWLVSATPAPNSMDEYFSYFKILGLRGTDSLRDFRRYWLNSADGLDGCNNIEIGLERFQLHRSHDTEFGGVGILADVPQSSEQTQTVTLSDEERTIYDAVVGPMQKEQTELATKIREQKMNLADNSAKGFREDLVRKSKATFAKILQLHKITAHPFLIETVMMSKDFSAAQVKEMLDSIRGIPDSSFHEHAKPFFAQIEARGLCRSQSVDSQSQFSESTSHGENNEGNMEVHMDYTLGQKALQRKCYLCPGEKIPINAVLTECGHAFCQRHFKLMTTMARMERPEEPVSCIVCENPIGTQKDVDQTVYVEAREAFLAETKSTGRPAKAMHKGDERERKRGDDFNGFQPRGMTSSWLARSDKSHPELPLVQSSKTRAVLEAIDSWQKEAPNDKIIVFTQWVMMGKILGRNFEDKGIQFVYYFGEMSDAERSKNLQTFEMDSDVKVIIMGFRCGGQGLDMYYANRVILVDPWWNDDGEAQGFARVKRKIQKKETFFLRLMAKDTIDMRVADIQKSKREMVQRLRKEDDPLKRNEIEMEYALKACDLGLTSKAESGPDEDSEQSATDTQERVAFHGRGNYQNAKATKAAEAEKFKSEYTTKEYAEKHGKRRGVGDAEDESRTKQTFATSKISRSDSGSNNQSTYRPIKREDADDTMDI